MLIGRIDKAFIPSVRYPATDLSKHLQQDREKHCGENRGNHGDDGVTFAAVAYQRLGNKKGCCRTILAVVTSESLF